MRIFDGHCDTLLKIFERCPYDFSFKIADNCESFIQTFAYYHEEGAPFELSQALDFFKNYIQKNSRAQVIYTDFQMHKIIQKGGFGALLALENCGALKEDIYNLLYLYNLGVRSITLTWNYENAFAHGALCSKGGLTKKGEALILLAEKLGILIDLSHLNRQSFFDVINFGHGKLYCSHSSCDAICPNPRNLTDEQIKALYLRGGIICVCPNPLFITGTPEANICDYALHLRHVLDLTDGKGVAIGTDTDGTEFTCNHLKTTADLLALPQKLSDLGFENYEIQNIFLCNFNSFL